MAFNAHHIQDIKPGQAGKLLTWLQANFKVSEPFSFEVCHWRELESKGMMTIHREMAYLIQYNLVAPAGGTTDYYLTERGAHTDGKLL